MKKLLLPLSLAAAFLLGCNKDDDSANYEFHTIEIVNYGEFETVALPGYSIYIAPKNISTDPDENNGTSGIGSLLSGHGSVIRVGIDPHDGSPIWHDGVNFNVWTALESLGGNMFRLKLPKTLGKESLSIISKIDGLNSSDKDARWQSIALMSRVSGSSYADSLAYRSILFTDDPAPFTEGNNTYCYAGFTYCDSHTTVSGSYIDYGDEGNGRTMIFDNLTLSPGWNLVGSSFSLDDEGQITETYSNFMPTDGQWRICDSASLFE